MKKGLIVAALLGLVVFAGCYHNEEDKTTTDTSSTTTTAPATESTTK